MPTNKKTSDNIPNLPTYSNLLSPYGPAVFPDKLLDLENKEVTDGKIKLYTETSFTLSINAYNSTPEAKAKVQELMKVHKEPGLTAQALVEHWISDHATNTKLPADFKPLVHVHKDILKGILLPFLENKELASVKPEWLTKTFYAVQPDTMIAVADTLNKGEKDIFRHPNDPSVLGKKPFTADQQGTSTVGGPQPPATQSHDHDPFRNTATQQNGQDDTDEETPVVGVPDPDVAFVPVCSVQTPFTPEEEDWMVRNPSLAGLTKSMFEVDITEAGAQAGLEITLNKCLTIARNNQKRLCIIFPDRIHKCLVEWLEVFCKSYNAMHAEPRERDLVVGFPFAAILKMFPTILDDKRRFDFNTRGIRAPRQKHNRDDIDDEIANWNPDAEIRSQDLQSQHQHQPAISTNELKQAITEVLKEYLPQIAAQPATAKQSTATAQNLATAMSSMTGDSSIQSVVTAIGSAISADPATPVDAHGTTKGQSGIGEACVGKQFFRQHILCLTPGFYNMIMLPSPSIADICAGDVGMENKARLFDGVCYLGYKMHLQQYITSWNAHPHATTLRALIQEKGFQHSTSHDLSNMDGFQRSNLRSQLNSACKHFLDVTYMIQGGPGTGVPAKTQTAVDEAFDGSSRHLNAVLRQCEDGIINNNNKGGRNGGTSLARPSFAAQNTIPFTQYGYGATPAAPITGMMPATTQPAGTQALLPNPAVQPTGMFTGAQTPSGAMGELSAKIAQELNVELTFVARTRCNFCYSNASTRGSSEHPGGPENCPLLASNATERENNLRLSVKRFKETIASKHTGPQPLVFS